jgi:hypothetical protein
MRIATNCWVRNAALVVAAWNCLGCSDDNSLPDAGTVAGRGGVHGAAGRSGVAGNSGRDASGTGGAPDPTCTGPLPTQPVICGGQTCDAPAEIVENNVCVAPCCVDVAGVATCAAKSLSPDYPADCTLPAVPDPACPTLTATLDTTGPRTFTGCCNLAKGKCGIVSPTRPGCITESVLVTLPDPLESCGSVDGSAEDAGR